MHGLAEYNSVEAKRLYVDRFSIGICQIKTFQRLLELLQDTGSFIKRILEEN